jgi:Glycosyltransferase like family 2
MDQASAVRYAANPAIGRGVVQTRSTRSPLLLWGILCVCGGIGMHLLGVLLVFPRYVLGLNTLLLPFNEWIVWYSGMPIMAGFALALTDLFILFPGKRFSGEVRFDPIPNTGLTVALTAYNDELSIAQAVRDFLDHPLVRNVIVISNNSTDATFERARAAGAITFNETAQGYGQCVYRCLTEAIKHEDTDLIVLCEGDSTFRAYDLDKFLAYAPHADIVNGTRTVEALRQYTTQLSTFMYYGNLFVGKLLEAKHLGRCTITDVGTTYKLCRRDALRRLLPALDPSVNLEFNAHFLDTALRNNCSIVECPVTFHPRVGVSKGGNTGNLRAMQVGLRMMIGIVFGWRSIRWA